MGRRGAGWKIFSNFYLLFRGKRGHTVLGNCVYHEDTKMEMGLKLSADFGIHHGVTEPRREMRLKLSADFADVRRILADKRTA